MIRTMIHIDEEKCNGCGLCISACHEGAIALVDGVAKLIRDDYCDGLGNCLPVCPTGALSFEEREAAPFDEEAVKRHLAQNHKTKEDPSSSKREGPPSQEAACHADEICCSSKAPAPPAHTGGCPGSQARLLDRHPHENGASPGHFEQNFRHALSSENHHTASFSDGNSQLMQWPVQIKLAPWKAPYFQNANLLLAADCSAYAYGNFHSRFMKNKVTLIGCPKLDEGDYSEKLTEILRHNEIKSVTIVRMEVPCCSGLEYAVKKALQDCGKMIPWQIHILTTDGRLLEDELL